MRLPDTITLIQEVAAAQNISINDDTKRKIIEDVARTIAHLENTPGLRDVFAKRSDAEIAAGVKQYTAELANGATYPKDHPRLTNLFTISPVQATGENTQTLSHMLRDPKKLKAFKEEVTATANTPAAPGYKAAKWLKTQLNTPKRIEALIQLFEKIEVLETTQSANRPSGHAESHAEIDQFYKQLNRDQKTTLNSIVFKDAGIGIINPKKPAAMTRRSFLAGLSATGLGVTAAVKHSKAVKDFDDAVTTPKQNDTAAKKEEKAPEDFFGTRAAERINNPDVRPVIEDVTQRERRAGYYAAGAVAAAGYSMQQFVRSIKAVRTEDFREKIATILTSMDAVVEDTQTKIKKSDVQR